VGNFRLKAEATRSDDDVDLAALSDEELDLAWDPWFDLAQSTNEADPPYTHGVFVTAPTPCDEAIRARGGSPPRPG
jgi:hypothetical protein